MIPDRPEGTAPGAAKAQQVHQLFTRVASRYDVLNTVITFGLHHSWRRRCVQWSGAAAGERVLDLATGTGDLALAFKRAVGESGSVIGTDFNEAMMASASGKAFAARLDVRFEVADAMALPYPDASFDIVSIAWGLRNLSDPMQGLREMARVAKPGGRIMVLETGSLKNRWLTPLVGFYFRILMPLLATFAGGRKEDYLYLQESSLRFPSGDDLLALMNSTGAFASAQSQAILGGASWLYKGITRDDFR